MRLLGVDFGFARIGLATGELEFNITTPLSPLKASGTLKIDAEKIKLIAQKEQVDKVVVGIPYQSEGLSQKQAKICNQLAERLQEKGLKVYTVDESLTTIEADQELDELNITATKKRNLRDSIAACKILERFFSEYN